MRGNPISGARYFLNGFGLILKPGIRRYVVIPLAINIGIFIGVISLVAAQVTAVKDQYLPALPEVVTFVIVLLLVLILGAVWFFAFNLVANFVAGPFNGMLAEAVERHLTGRGPPEGAWQQIISDLGKSIQSELRKLVFILVRMVPLWLLLLVPGLNLVVPFLIMLLGAWLLAITYVDYPMGNHRLGFAEQRERLKGRPLLALGFGGCAMAALTVPVLNFVVIPVAVAGATAMWVGEFSAEGQDVGGPSDHAGVPDGDS